MIIGHTVTSKGTEINVSFEHLFTPCLLSVSLVLHLVNTKLGSPAFKVLQKIGNEYGAGSHIEVSLFSIIKDSCQGRNSSLVQDFHCFYVQNILIDSSWDQQMKTRVKENLTTEISEHFLLEGNKVITVKLDMSEEIILCWCSFANALLVSSSQVLSLLLE